MKNLHEHDAYWVSQVSQYNGYLSIVKRLSKLYLVFWVENKVVGALGDRHALLRLRKQSVPHNHLASRKERKSFIHNANVFLKFTSRAKHIPSARF